MKNLKPYEDKQMNIFRRQQERKQKKRLELIVANSNSWERSKDALVPYWVDEMGRFIEVYWDKAPSPEYHPLVWGDRPATKERLKELFDQAGGNPLKFARLVELEHGIRAYD